MSKDHLTAGEVLRGTYEVIGRIGKGSTGEVYEVSHTRLAGRYALKVLAAQTAERAMLLKRFRREARILSLLRHPHVVQILDFDQTEDGHPYLVMELLEGDNLEVVLRRAGPLPLGRVVGMVKQIASALSAAHARGVVHRDLKPENVLLLRMEGVDAASDFLKLVDFGICKVRNSNSRITTERVMIGTPHYMAPEQVRARQVDERTDQFALAVMTYELLAAELPFAGETIEQVAQQIVHGQPPRLADSVPWLGRSLDAVLRRALSKEPADRFPSVADFTRALADAAERVNDPGERTAAAPPTSAAARRAAAKTRKGLERPPAPERPRAPARPVRTRAFAVTVLALGMAASAGAIWLLSGDGSWIGDAAGTVSSSARPATAAPTPTPTPAPAPPPLSAAAVPPASSQRQPAPPASPPQVLAASPGNVRAGTIRLGSRRPRSSPAAVASDRSKRARRVAARARLATPDDRLYNDL